MITKHIPGIATRLSRFFFPPCCSSCGSRLIDGEQHVCTMCMTLMPRTILDDDHRENIFARRFWGLSGAVNGTAVFTYQPATGLSKVVHEMKYFHKADLCRFMGRVMTTSPQVRQLLAEADIMIPVPITKDRRKTRGYNQSELLCEGISSVVKMPINTTALKRIRFVESQTTLTLQQRLDNVKGAFALGDTSEIEGRHIVIVDDVVTTGATTLECLFTLRNVPGIKISILALAWTGGDWM